MEVVGEEAECGAAGGGDDDQGGIEMRARGDHRERTEHREDDSRSEPVEAVNQVDRVDDGDDPEDRCRQGEPPELDHAPRQVEGIDAQAEGPSQRGGPDLGGQLDPGRHPVEVVDDPDHDEQCCAGQDRRDPVRLELADGAKGRGRNRRGRDRDLDGENHRHAAEARRWGEMPDHSTARRSR